jgi:predicted secreted Zn-dependent protease
VQQSEDVMRLKMAEIERALVRMRVTEDERINQVRREMQQNHQVEMDRMLQIQLQEKVGKEQAQTALDQARTALG